MLQHLKSFGALLNGAELHLIQKEDLLNITKLENILKTHNITILWLTSALFNCIVDTSSLIFQNLKYLMVGGDVLSTKYINKVIDICPNVKIINGYGPTENTTFSTCFTIDKKYEKNIPIGKPISNSTCYVVDKNGNLQPSQFPGELWVGGDGVCLGYLNNEELTKEKFIDNPFLPNDKIYKTGDIVYTDKNGNINFIGRKDNQIKIRGFRVEIDEIQNKILEFPDVLQTYIVYKKENSNGYLIAYFTSKININISTLKEFLSAHLPKYMIPTYIINLPTMPLNTNGKVDKNKLPEPTSKDSVLDEFISARNDLDSKLIEIFKTILKISNIGITNNLFENGLDSLSCIKAINLIEQNLNVSLSIQDMFDLECIKNISDFIKNKNNTIDSLTQNITITKANEQYFYPVSSAQKRIYFATCANENAKLLYNIPFKILINGKIDVQKLLSSIKEIILRHATLRASIHVLDGEIVQRINDLDLNQIKVLNIIKTYNDFLVNSYYIDDFLEDFTLKKAPLFNIKLLSFIDDTYLLLMDFHHSIFDGTSMHIFIDELNKLYNNETLSPLNITYPDFSVWENNALNNNFFDKSINFWKNQFIDTPETLNLPYDSLLENKITFEGKTICYTLENNISNKIKDFCDNKKITPFMLFLSAYYIMLHKHCKQDDIVIGVPASARINNDTQELIGMFVNTLPLRRHVYDDTIILDFLNNLKEFCFDAFANQYYSFNKILELINCDANSLVKVLFTYQNFGIPKLILGDVQASPEKIVDNIAKFDISLEIIPNDLNFILNFEYSTESFKEDTINNFANHYINILKFIINNYDKKIGATNMLSDVEQSIILNEFNNTYLDYDKTKTIYNLFEEQANKTPSNIALAYENSELSYDELNKKANQIAHKLIAQNIKPNDVVAVLMPRSLEMLIAILGILKSGACYLPIDSDYPEDRIKYMLENSNAKLVLTLNDNYNVITNTIKITDTLFTGNDSNPNIINNIEDSSYMIYTSGSTGKPKGTVLTHKGLSNLTAFLNNYVEYLKEPTATTIVSVTTISFDIFIFETLIALQKGLKVVIASEDERRVPSLLDALIQKHNIEIIQTTPSRIQILVNNIENIPSFKNLKYIILAGEPFTDHLANSLRTLTKAKLYNGYGPSETTVFSTFTDVTNQEKINIGKPLANTQIYILDTNQNLCPVGIEGEIYIAGDGVGKGYYNNKELTNSRYLKNPFIENSIMYKTGDLGKYLKNGEIECLGRVDNQIKIRGLRIELEEIESTILKYKNIKNCVVIERKEVQTNRQYLCAYFTATNKTSLPELRKFLGSSLPNYMIPSYLVQLDNLPYTPNGKIDKKALPEPNFNVVEKEVSIPTTDIEINLWKIWKKVLKISDIGIEDNFFELGGDSVLAMNMQIEVLKYYPITYSDIFKFPTIKTLAKNILDNIALSKKSEVKDFSYLKYSSLLENNIVLPTTFTKNNLGSILLTGVTRIFRNTSFKRIYRTRTWKYILYN